MRDADCAPCLVDVRYFLELLGDEERCALPVQEPRDAPAAHEGDGFELLDRRIHRVEAVGVELESADRFDAGNEEDETARQVALTVLVLPAELRIAQASVLLAQRRLPPAEDADRALARVVHRHRRVAFAVAHPAVGRVLAPEPLLVRPPSDQLVRHHRLPHVRRKHDREPVEPLCAVAAVFAVRRQDLFSDLRTRKVVWPHREPRHILRDQRRLELRHSLADCALDRLERMVRRDAALVDLLRLGMFGGLLGEHLDARPNLAAGGDACGPLAKQRGQYRLRSIDRYHRVGHVETPS